MESLSGRVLNKNGVLEANEVPAGPVKERFPQFDRNRDGHIDRSEWEGMRHIFAAANNRMVAIKPGGKGDVTKTHVAWKAKSGWATVREALTMGPRRGEDTVTPHTRPPADEDGEHTLVRTVACVKGSVEVELVCDPAFDYGRTPGEWSPR